MDLIRKAKRDYLEKKLDKNKNNPKDMWGTLKELLKGNHSSNNMYKQILCGGKIFTDIEKMANIFNKYFVDSIMLLRESDSNMDSIREIKYTENVFEVFRIVEVTYYEQVIQELVIKVEQRKV